jgi:hypothetical protein
MALLLVVAGSAASQTVLSLPVDEPSAVAPSIGNDLVYRIDLDSLPVRPVIVVDVVPDALHGDIQLEVEVTNFSVAALPPDSIGCPLTEMPAESWRSLPTAGATNLEAELFFCGPYLNLGQGGLAVVRIRVLDFGTAVETADLDISIRGITGFPTELLVQQVSGSQSVRVELTEDTVLYADDAGASNGSGQYLWSGRRTVPVPPFRYRRNTLLNVFVLESTVPSNAAITDAALTLQAPSLLGNVSLSAVGDSPNDATWIEGNDDAAGDEFMGVVGGFPGATFDDQTSDEAWSTPGGDITSAGVLASLQIDSI